MGASSSETMGLKYISKRVLCRARSFGRVQVDNIITIYICGGKWVTTLTKHVYSLSFP